MNNKIFSDRQEKMVANYLDFVQVSGSGARPFRPGDVTSEVWLCECKTHDTVGDKISFKRTHWVKLCNEALGVNRYPVLITDNGSQRSDYTWVMIPLRLIPSDIVNIIDGIKNSSTKGSSFTFKHDLAKTTYTVNSEDDKVNVFKAEFGEVLAVMPISTFRDFVKEYF